jgi:hypothetical protein
MGINDQAQKNKWDSKKVLLIITPVLIAILTFAGGFVVGRMPRFTSDEPKIIDQSITPTPQLTTIASVSPITSTIPSSNIQTLPFQFNLPQGYEVINFPLGVLERNKLSLTIVDSNINDSRITINYRKATFEQYDALTSSGDKSRDEGQIIEILMKVDTVEQCGEIKTIEKQVIETKTVYYGQESDEECNYFATVYGIALKDNFFVTVSSSSQNKAEIDALKAIILSIKAE